MGNYSRNTYDPTKGYTSVRLQQGVPLVDADWNEAADVLRNELYATTQLVLPDGFPQGSNVLRMFALTDPNDLVTSAGSFPFGGRLATLPQTAAFFIPITVYSQQRWANAALAAHDGVAVIPPLTTPAAARADLVYADIWEQEIGSGDDPNLINPVIGVETCVRLKRTVAIRVAEGSTTLPAAPTGHSFLLVAQLARTAGAATITDTMITDVRQVYASAYGQRTVYMHPDLRPFSAAVAAWYNVVPYSYLPSGAGSANGYLSLPLPDRARNVSINISGDCFGTGNVYADFWQIGSGGAATILANPSYNATASGTFALNAIPVSGYVVDRTRWSYLLQIYALSTSIIDIYPIQLNFTL